MASESDGESYLLMQREEALLAQPFDTGASDTQRCTDRRRRRRRRLRRGNLWPLVRRPQRDARLSRGRNRLAPVDLGRRCGSQRDYGWGTRPLRRYALSPDGQRIAFALAGRTGQSGYLGQGCGARRQHEADLRSTADDSPVWSPDGTKIAFAANRGGSTDLYEKNADGSGEERLLLKSDQNKTPTSWSRDGRFLCSSPSI